MKQFSHDLKNDSPVEASHAWAKRSSMKLDQSKASIAVIIPIGNKQVNTAFTDGNGVKWLAPGHVAPGLVPVPFLMATMQLAMPLNTTALWFTKHGVYSGQARQEMTMVALPQLHDHDNSYILYWDDDTIPDDALSLYTMHHAMEQDKSIGILSGYYSTRNDPSSPVIFRPHGQGCDWEVKLGPTTGPQEVWAVGAGFMLVRVSAIRKAMELFPDEPLWADMKAIQVEGDKHDPVWGQNVNWGHDTRFCEMIRQAGYKVMVDGRVECGHWDRTKGIFYRLPPDAAPRRLGRKYNGEAYWDKVYGMEDANTARANIELFKCVADYVLPGDNVVEIGCGSGLLGQYLTAKRGVQWTGFDQSEVAVEIAKARFLNAVAMPLTKLTAADLPNSELVIATEVIEHLQPEEIDHLVNLVTHDKRRLIFSVPDNCMPPEEVPEHTALFNAEKVHEIFDPYCEKFEYKLAVDKGDEHRLLCIFEPIAE